MKCTETVFNSTRMALNRTSCGAESVLISSSQMQVAATVALDPPGLDLNVGTRSIADFISQHLELNVLIESHLLTGQGDQKHGPLPLTQFHQADLGHTLDAS